jgi:hypothetical protein
MQKTSPIALEISTATRVVRVIFSSSDGKLEWLDVNFQEVVHSALTGSADVAKPQ